jgi:hypothetical protein
MRKQSVQHSLRSITKAVQAHREAADAFNTATDVMHGVLFEYAKSLSAASEGDRQIQGYIGHLGKLVKAHSAGHSAGKMAHSSFADGVDKCVKAAAGAAGVDISIGNANSSGANNDTMHGSANVTSPGEVVQGFKASGVTADVQTRLAKSVPTSNAAPFISGVRALTGGLNKNAYVDPCDFSKERGVDSGSPAESRGTQTQVRVLSEFQKRAKS